MFRVTRGVITSLVALLFLVKGANIPIGPASYPVYILEETFAGEDKWHNETGGHFARDTVNQQLVWHVDQLSDEKYYISVNAASYPQSSLAEYRGDFVLRTRIKITQWSGDNNLFIGLADNLTGCTLAPSCPTGLFVEIGKNSGLATPNYIRATATYTDNSFASTGFLSYDLNVRAHDIANNS